MRSEHREKIMPRVAEPQGERNGGAGGLQGFKTRRAAQYCQRVGESGEGISRYRDHSQLTNVPFSQAAVMKAIFLDLS